MIWYCLEIAEGREERAHYQLEAAGFKSLYLHEAPRRVYDKSKRRTVESAEKPGALFPGYGFAARSPAECPDDWIARIRRQTYWSAQQARYRPIIRGVLGQIVHGDAEIERLRAILGTFGAMPTARRLKPHDRVRITDGHGAGLIVTIEVLTKHRARVLLGSITVLIDLDNLEPVSLSA